MDADGHVSRRVSQSRSRIKSRYLKIKLEIFSALLLYLLSHKKLIDNFPVEQRACMHHARYPVDINETTTTTKLSNCTCECE